jgi:hypothetical protein
MHARYIGRKMKARKGWFVQLFCLFDAFNGKNEKLLLQNFVFNILHTTVIGIRGLVLLIKLPSRIHTDKKKSAVRHSSAN